MDTFSLCVVCLCVFVCMCVCVHVKARYYAECFSLSHSTKIFETVPLIESGAHWLTRLASEFFLSLTPIPIPLHCMH